MAINLILSWLHKNIIALGVIVSTIAGLSGSGIAVYSHFAKEARVAQAECEINATINILSTELALLRAEVEFSDTSLRLLKLLKIKNPQPIIQEEIIKLQNKNNVLSSLIVNWKNELEHNNAPKEECKKK